MFCPNCGTAAADDAKFCSQCGKLFAAAAPVSAPAPSLTTATATAVAPQAAAAAQTDGKAIASLVLGILALVLLAVVAASLTSFLPDLQNVLMISIVGLVSGAIAIILGHVARSSITQSPEQFTGINFATAGLVMGHTSVIALVVTLGSSHQASAVAANLSRSRTVANAEAAAATVRTLATTEVVYSTTYPDKGYAPDLKILGPGPTRTCSEPTAAHACLIDAVLGCANQPCVKDEYQYSITGTLSGGMTTDFVILAVPAERAGDGKAYCASSDAVIRY